MPNSLEQFEEAFSRWVGVAHGFTFWKGRVAMYAIMKAMGVSEGDEVILPGYTCVMDVNPIKYLRAKPIYVDIEPDTYNMDPSLLAEAITPRTKVIVAQHTYGFPCEMDAIMDIANRHGLAVIEDCCLSLGSRYKGKLCGTFGQAAYWSFQWNKPFTTGIGGMATTHDDSLAEKIRSLCEASLVSPSAKASAMLAAQRLVYRACIFPRTTALAAQLFRWMTRKGLVIGSSTTCEFEPTMAEDFFKGMSPGQARAGLRQIRKLEDGIAHRKQMLSVYDDLARQAGWDIPQRPNYMESVPVRYPICVADKARAVAEAPKAGVEIGTWFECPLHPIETPLDQYDYQEGMCPIAEQVCREVINLPTHPRAGVKTARRSVALAASIGPAATEAPRP